MSRRYAILDDNDRLLRERIDRLRGLLPPLIASRACAAMVIGSVAEGRARDESDCDVLLVLAHGVPRRSDYDWWDGEVVPRLAPGLSDRFPLQPVVIGRHSLTTSEAHLRRAIANGIPLWDPEGLFHDQPEPGR
jgi:predicted nucleotidyltransferase